MVKKSNGIRNGIPASVLKWIAVITMLIDHIGATLLRQYRLMYPDLEAIRIIYRIFRNIGRLSFPLFIFLLTEGFYYTHSKKKYLLRMFLFGILSEIPFDLAFYHKAFYFQKQNVYFTLTIGLLAIYLIEFIDKKWRQNTFSVITLKSYFKVLVIAVCNLAAWFLKTDYSFSGVSAIIVMYCVKTYMEAPLIFRYGKPLHAEKMSGTFTRKANETKSETMIGDPDEKSIKRKRGKKSGKKPEAVPTPRDALHRCLDMIAMSATCLVLLTSSFSEAFAFIDTPLVFAYNGKRGRQMKYFFYLFYPVHLLLLWLLINLVFPGS